MWTCRKGEFRGKLIIRGARRRNMRTHSPARVVFLIAVCLAAGVWGYGNTADTQLSRDQQEDFLLHAKVIRSRRIGKGVTNPYRLTLSNGTVTHDASFQPVFVRENYKKFDNGTTELNYVDSYLYNIAAYRLAVLLGLENMMPVTVERKWGGMIGALSWWLPVQMDEGERMEKDLKPPDIEAHNRQMHKMRVFAELVYDTDRNIGNVLIGEDWEIYMIDFTRAFRLYRELKDSSNLERCSRDLLENLRQLDIETLLRNTEGLLTKNEAEAVMARRDLIVGYFKKLVAEKGEEAVLY